MESQVSNLPPGDARLINEIVNKVKAQGLFDKFRKDCLADVDTKPAYQNLRLRVENYVSSFLSKQKWDPKLNKNQLRDSLRRQIHQSGMLAKGVERIVEQVVNPKIQSVFKPEIDKVVCEQLGIDYDEREKQIKALAEKSMEKSEFTSPVRNNDHNPQSSFASPGNRNIQDLMNINLFSPPPMHNMPNTSSAPPSFSQQVMGMGLGPGPGPGFLPNMFPGNNPNMFPPGNPMIPPMGNPMIPMPGNPMVPMQGNSMFPPNFGFPQANFEGMGPDRSDMGMPPDMAPSFESGINIPGYPLKLGFDQDFIQEESNNSTTSKTKENKKDKTETKEHKMDTAALLDSLLNIPLPKSDPTEKSPTKQIKDKSKEKNNGSKNSNITDDEHDRIENEAEDMEIDIEEEVTEQEITIEEIPLPDSAYEQDPKVSEVEATNQDLATKQYHFAWDDIQDRVSEVTVSSVHTSDLSSFEESEADEEEVTDEKEDEPSDANEETSSESETNGSEVETSDSTGQDTSPVKKSKVKEIAERSIPLTPTSEEKKPRRLISLAYNLSDSDSDETREERKARVAKEKEERYLKRQMRRAEIEAKRKEKESEGTAAKNETLIKSSEEETTEKSDLDASDVTETNSEYVKSPEKKAKSNVKKRKTKQALKEELREQKVQEKRMALRRQRTINKKYTSDDFTSIFTRKRNILSNESYDEVVEEQVIDSGVVAGSEVYVEHGTNLYEKELGTETEDEEKDLGTPTQDEEREPGTPTQDEVEYSAPENELILTTEHSNIPIYEVTPNSGSGLTIGQLVHNTRSARRKSEGQNSRPNTPFSDTSEASGEGRQRKSARKKTVEQLSPADNENRPRSRQRYDASDLYKPRISRRRGSPSSNTSSLHDVGEGKGKSPRVTSPVVVSPQADSSRDRSRSRSVLSDNSSGQSQSCSPDRRPRSMTPTDDISFGEAEKRSRQSDREAEKRMRNVRECFPPHGTGRQNTPHNTGRHGSRHKQSFGEAERRTRYSNRLSQPLLRGSRQNFAQTKNRSSWKYQNEVSRSPGYGSDHGRASSREPRGQTPTPGDDLYLRRDVYHNTQTMSRSQSPPRGPRTPPEHYSPTSSGHAEEEIVYDEDHHSPPGGPKTPPMPSGPRTPSPEPTKITHYTPPRTRGHDKIPAHDPSPPHTRRSSRIPSNSGISHVSPPLTRDSRRTRAISPPQRGHRGRGQVTTHMEIGRRSLRKRSVDDNQQYGGGKRPRR